MNKMEKRKIRQFFSAKISLNFLNRFREEKVKRNVLLTSEFTESNYLKFAPVYKRNNKDKAYILITIAILNLWSSFIRLY